MSEASAVPDSTASTRVEPAWRALLAAASAPYRAAGPLAWRFARGKLGMDPVFRHLLESGLLPPQSRVLDIGCGQGLLASLLHAADQAGGSGAWPAGWAAAPRGCRVTGIELSARDVARARAAWAGHPSAQQPTWVCADMREAAFPPSDVVVLLDVLHYIDPAAQETVLARAQAALAPQGRLLLRVGDAQASSRFQFSQWVDGLVCRLRGLPMAHTHGRPLAAWQALLERLGFVVQARPMSQGTPFANVLLVAHKTATHNKAAGPCAAATGEMT